jgi:ribonucleoside-diphosphate reductase alpha chain
MDNELHVTKRNGKLEEVSFDKIFKRFKTLGQEAKIDSIKYSALAMDVINQLYDKIPTTKIDELCAQECIARETTHIDYGLLASRIIITNHHKTTTANFYKTMQQIYKTGLLSQEYWATVQKNRTEWDKIIDYKRDFLIDYFGFKTLERSYLIRVNNIVVERPQHMWLRVSIAIHPDGNLEKIKTTYDLMSQKYYTHATPTLFNAGISNGQLSSCFLVSMEDSIEGIYDTLKECAIISKNAGGIGVHIHKIRAKGSYIKGTNGYSNGVVPMMCVVNATARYVDQGGGKRKGSIALYMEPWHADIEGFLSAKRNQGEETSKSRDLFYALWIPDLFMKRVLANESWSLFCPNKCPNLSEVYGDDFEALYTKYESEGRANATFPASELWNKIIETQIETGTPYILYKDAVNKKSNQKNVGVIKSSNLCTEIMEYSDEQETAVCNLASIALPTFVHPETHVFDYEKLHEVAGIVAENLNQVIDLTHYPSEKASRSNLRHRPIGMGVQGLADTLLLMDIAYDSESAREVNRLIFETIYHGALTKSNELAKQKGSYSSFANSPTSLGQLQFDLWGVSPTPNRYDWDGLKSQIVSDGLRNSLLVAPMPTASTSQILGFNECFEPFTSNIYTRKTLAGDFPVLNKYLVKELMKEGKWTKELKDDIIKHDGSVQHLAQFSSHFRNKYKMVWEISQKQLIDMAADRAPFICQSQSMNLWMANPVVSKVHSMHFYAWKKGLKTGMYYLHTKAKHQAEQFTISPSSNPSPSNPAPSLASCSQDRECMMCSS